MEAKMRLVSLTGHQRCAGNNSLWIRIPFRAGARLIFRLFVPAELAPKAAYANSPGLNAIPPRHRPFDAVSGAFGGQIRSRPGFAPTLYCACRILWRRIKLLPASFPPRMALGANISPQRGNRVEGTALYASLKPYQQGRLPWPFR
jgi:hypothetical protein